MPRLARFPIAAGCAIGIVSMFLAVVRDGDITTPRDPATGRGAQAAETAYRALPPPFEANLGQTDRRVLFLSRGHGYALFLTREGAVLKLPRADQGDTNEALGSRTWRASEGAAETAVGFTFVDANPHPRVSGVEQLTGVSNYLTGNDRGDWITDVPHYARVTYEALYEGVDLTYYGNHEGELEFDFTVAAGVDPSTIRLAYTGASDLTIDGNGALCSTSRAPSCANPGRRCTNRSTARCGRSRAGSYSTVRTRWDSSWRTTTGMLRS